jgi:GT2 family glycosyltransferase
MNFHERDVIDGAGDVYTWSGAAGRRGHGERDVGQYDEPRAIFAACAGAALYRRAAFEKVGYFDEDFFAVYEDVDWGLRSQLAGFACRYVPTAIVYHMESTTIGSDQTDFVRYQIWRNGLWVVAKDLPLGALLAHAPRLMLGQAVNLAVARREGKLKLLWRAWRDALRGLPRLLRKRREVQARRSISLRDLNRLIGADGDATESS